jgi:hypothetical protein
MVIEEEMQSKGIEKIFSKIIVKNFPNLKKEMPVQVQEACRTQKRHGQNRTSPLHIIVITLTTEYKERILKTERRNSKITCNSRFLTETLRARRAWNEAFQVWKENNFNHRLLYPEKLSFIIEGEIKYFQDKQKQSNL